MVGVWEYFFWSCCGPPARVRASKKLKTAAGRARAKRIVRILMKFFFVMMVRLMKPQSRYHGRGIACVSPAGRSQIRMVELNCGVLIYGKLRRLVAGSKLEQS